MIVSSYSFGFRKTKSKPNLYYHCTITFRSKNLLLKLLRREKGMFKMNLMFKESTCSSLENIVASPSGGCWKTLLATLVGLLTTFAMKK